MTDFLRVIRLNLQFENILNFTLYLYLCITLNTGVVQMLKSISDDLSKQELAEVKFD